MDELKSALNATIHCESNKSSVYTLYYTLKNWMDADLSCKAEGKHLVSFDSMDEFNHVFELISKECSIYGFWTSARDLGGDNWIWRNSGDMVLDDLWGGSEPTGDGDCGHMFLNFTPYQLNDASCELKMCYICESL